jgi:hypothetical protein
MFTGQTTGAVQDVDDLSVFTANNNRFDSNAYYLPSLDGGSFSWMDADLSWAQWRDSGRGNDRAGWAELVRPAPGPSS